jgi:septum formation inhibitor-activating ATPase MinD
LKGRDEGDAAAIVVIKCPKCSTPIRNSNRYIKLLNERAMQIDKVKKKLLGDKTKNELVVEWEQLRAQMMAIQLEMNTVTLSEEQVGVDG